MPELPEVETAVRDFNKNRALKILGARFVDVWTDASKIIKKPKSFEDFKKGVKGKKIKKIWRRGKNIIFDLSEGSSLLVHQKMTGHFLVGNWKLKKGIWEPLSEGALKDPANRFIHLIFFLDNGKMLAFSDLRKFAKIELWNSKDLKESKDLKNLGIEPLSSGFTFNKFKGLLRDKKGRIKQVLMDQEVIAGIGNIYSDEILWEAKIHPLRETSGLGNKEMKALYENTKKVLKEAILLRGTSVSDFRDLEGKKGKFGEKRKVYRKEGEKCQRCGSIIKRIKIGGRSGHFCPFCQTPGVCGRCH